VTVLERAPQLLKKEDADVVEMLCDLLREEGVDLQLNSAVERIEKDGKGVAVVLTTDGKTTRVSGSHLLVALGRTPNTEELNLTAAGVEVDKRGFVKVNERLETTASGIWALGDVNGGPQFTHASFDDYRIVKANVFDGGQRTTTDRLVPFTLFTEPELARVGLTEKEARQQGLDIRVAKLPVAAIPRAKTMSETRGFCDGSHSGMHHSFRRSRGDAGCGANGDDSRPAVRGLAGRRAVAPDSGGRLQQLICECSTSWAGLTFSQFGERIASPRQ
jgi:probable pyridine nucleotide-disulfide oxidoreductase